MNLNTCQKREIPNEDNKTHYPILGDIFAAAFFVRLYTTRDPWEAARFATQLSAISITRPGFSGIPTPQEIEECMVEVF